MSIRPGGRAVVVARGSSEEELRAIAETLNGAGVRFQVEERILGPQEAPQWSWEVIIDEAQMDAARRALAPEPEPPASVESSGEPLFDSRAGEVLRVGLMLASFGMAGGLWLQTCVS